MAKECESFLDELKTICPELPEGDVKNITNDSSLSTLEDFTKAKFVNYDAKRKDLYKLSMDIEAYAVKNYVPLLATFETENLYKYVQKRYTDILKKIPHAWVIGGFDDPFLIPPETVPQTAEILSCLDTNIEKMWIVVTKGPDGPFGLVAEDLGDGNFRGFFTMDNKIIEKVISIINKTMRIEISFNKN